MKQLFLLFGMLFSTMAFSQVANDECAGAILLTPSSTCTQVDGTLENATASAVTAGCGTYNDVFYTFTASCVTTKVTIKPSGSLDLIVSFYQTCGASPILCKNNGYEGQEEVIDLFDLTIGSIYFVKVANAYQTSASKAFTICVQNIDAPSNDECSNAIDLTPGSVCSEINGVITGATTSVADEGCVGYNDVFYKLTTTSSLTSVTVIPVGYNLDPILSVYNGCGITNTRCENNGSSGDPEIVDLTGPAGTTYYLKVASKYANASGTFTICAQNITPASNDECAGAITLTPSSSCNPISGSLANTSTTLITSSCFGYKDVFYKFVATSKAVYIKVVPSSGLSPGISVYSQCNSSSKLSCKNYGYIGVTQVADFSDLTIGNTYYINVSSREALPATNTFTICVQNIVPPSNDECTDAITFIPSSTCNTIDGSLENTTVSRITTYCYTSKDAFYKFKATASSASISVTGSAQLDVVVGVYMNCGYPSMTCTDNSQKGGTETINLTSLTVGNDYYVKVASFYQYPDPETSTFTFCVTSNPITTQTQEATSLNAISLFPNPAQNTLQVGNITDETTVEILNVNGASLLKKSLTADDSLDLSNLTSGIYIVQLSLNGVTENKRIVVTK